MAFLNYRGRKLVFGLREHDLSQFQDSATPLYLYEWSGIKHRYEKMKAAFQNKAELHFAMKSNSYPEVLRRMSALGSGVDVVSAGEMQIALDCGFLASKIVFSGVGKSKSEIREALKAEIQQINVESEPELQRILNIATDMNVKAAVALRLNPDVSPETHPYITTGFRENKFGLEKSAALRCLELIRSNPAHLHFRGLTLHIGSQLFNLEDYADAIDWILAFADEVETTGLKIESLDLGGGLGIYYESDRHADEEQLLERYASMVLEKTKGRPYQLQLEPGRWIVAHSGVLLTRVQYLKETPYKNFLVVDTGMHHLIRPALYSASHRIFPLLEQASSDVFDVVGPICESSDFLGHNVPLPRLQEDDLLAIADAGAYGYEMSSEYNSHARPQRILLD